jgi:hypothetical protein
MPGDLSQTNRIRRLKPHQQMHKVHPAVGKTNLVGFVLFVAVSSFAKTSATEENPPVFMTFVHPAIGHSIIIILNQ